MLSGVVNHSSWSQLLQSIAQRRKQGELLISLAEKTIRIFFIQGKIVDAQTSEISSAQETCNVIKLCNVTPVTYKFAGTTYKELEHELLQVLGDKSASQNIIRAAALKKTLDFLHSFSILGTVSWSFRVGGVEIPREIAASVATGQLLIDAAEQESINSNFDSKFSESQFCQVKSAFKAKDEAEELVSKSLSAGPKNLGDFLNKTLFPKLYLKRSLLSLYESGVIGIGDLSVKQEISDRVDKTDVSNESREEETPQATEIQLVPRFTPEGFEESIWSANIVAIVFLLAAIVVPIFFWGDVVGQF